MDRISFVCRHCRSYRLSFDATVYWDEDDQSFQMSEFDPTLSGRAYCADCDGETTAVQTNTLEKDND